MSFQANNLKLTAAWIRATPAANRWQVLQTQLSQSAATQEFGWAQRSSVVCKWRALPASVSAPMGASR